jgi:Transcription factor WhiB
VTAMMSDCAAGQAVTARPAAELERIVLAAQRPCVASDTSPEEWFPIEPGPGNQVRARALYEALALALCRGCPVALECLELTLRREGPRRGHGIAGVTAPWQRQRIKAGRGLAVRS